MTASCFSPFGPVTVENMLAVRPAPYVGVPLTSSGGHAAAHAPVQLDLPGVVSLSQMYNVMPLLSTRIDLPIFAFDATATAAKADGAAVVPGVAVVAGGADVPVAAVVELELDLLLLPQAANASAAKAAVATTRRNWVRMNPP